jgi:hypothetical protein
MQSPSPREAFLIIALCVSGAISSSLMGCGRNPQPPRDCKCGPAPAGPVGPPGNDGRDGRDGQDGLSIKGETGPRGPAGADSKALTRAEIEAIVDTRIRQCWNTPTSKPRK